MAIGGTVIHVHADRVVEDGIAAVRVLVPFGGLADAWRPALDEVWALLGRSSDLRRPGGHNVFVYRHPASPNAPMEVDFGVQVARAFPAEGRVRYTSTPAGHAARAVHHGAYDEMERTHDAIRAWCAANGHVLAGVSWEVYGDWSDAPAALETAVSYLLVG